MVINEEKGMGMEMGMVKGLMGVEKDLGGGKRWLRTKEI
jgi:hypothetical protein